MVQNRNSKTIIREYALKHGIRYSEAARQLEYKSTTPAGRIPLIDGLDATLVERIAEALSDSLTMLGLPPDERPEHGGSSIAEVLAAIAIRAIRVDAAASQPVLRGIEEHIQARIDHPEDEPIWIEADYLHAHTLYKYIQPADSVSIPDRLRATLSKNLLGVKLECDSLYGMIKDPQGVEMETWEAEHPNGIMQEEVEMINLHVADTDEEKRTVSGDKADAVARMASDKLNEHVAEASIHYSEIWAVFFEPHDEGSTVGGFEWGPTLPEVESLYTKWSGDPDFDNSDLSLYRIPINARMTSMSVTRFIDSRYISQEPPHDPLRKRTGSDTPAGSIDGQNSS